MAGESMFPIMGGPSVLSMNGSEWRTWRTLLSPGFSATSLTEYVPFAVDSIETLVAKLKERAMDGQVFSLDDYMTRLTFDVIMKVALCVLAAKVPATRLIRGTGTRILVINGRNTYFPRL